MLTTIKTEGGINSSQKLNYAINKQNDAPLRNFVARISKHWQSSVADGRYFAVLLLQWQRLSGIELMN
jgi:hypothetical protein